MQVQVQVIKVKEQAALVQWENDDGFLRRATIPRSALVDGTFVEQEDLDMGVPWGAPWEEMVTVSATPETIADRLRRASIWRAEDLMIRPREAQGALQAAYGIDLAALLQAAKVYMQGR